MSDPEAGSLDLTGRALEERVALIFTEAGCDARTRHQVAGARATHVLDVWVSFRSLGMPDTWAVECKDQAAVTPKADVLTFRGVVEDVGASRGLLVARSGFQPAALDAASNTNVMLLTEGELNSLLERHIRDHKQRILADRILLVRDRMADEIEVVERTRKTRKSRIRKPALQDKFLTYLGMVSLLESRTDDLRLRRNPRLILPDIDTEEPRWAKDEEEYFRLAHEFLDRIESWLESDE